MKLSPVHILNVSGGLLHRSRNVPSPTDAGRTPSASCLGGRSLVLRSLRPASSGSANIIHVIVSCCALFLFLLFWSLSGGDGLPCELSSRGADCPLVAAMRAFFLSPALGLLLSWRPPLARSVRKGTNRANLTLPLVGTNRRPFLSPFSFTFLRQETYPPRAPARPLSVNKKSGGA